MILGGYPRSEEMDIKMSGCGDVCYQRFFRCRAKKLLQGDIGRPRQNTHHLVN